MSGTALYLRLLLLAVPALLLVMPAARADAARVAVAANFMATMRVLEKAFEQESGHALELVFASSGQLYAQIRHGAPFAVFLSADQAKPAALEEAGLVVAGSRFTYAVGALVLWSAQEGLVDKRGEILKQGRFRRLALANPRLAPYGAAAVQVLHALGLAESTRDRWVLGQNIAQTYQFVFSGSAPIGLVALSQLRAGDRQERGSAWRVPDSLHRPIRQDAVLLSRGAGSPAARSLMAFLGQDRAARIIRRAGYRLPEAE